MPDDSDFKNRFSDFIDAHACILEETGVVHLNRDTDSVPFVSTKGLNGLIIDSIRQVNERVIGLVTSQEKRIEELETWTRDPQKGGVVEGQKKKGLFGRIFKRKNQE